MDNPATTLTPENRLLLYPGLMSGRSDDEPPPRRISRVATGRVVKREYSSPQQDCSRPPPGLDVLPRQGISVIQSTPCGALLQRTPQVQARKSGRFKANWLDAYSWLRYDQQSNLMYCEFCRKWNDSIPEIRTSFAAGNGNFRLEIVNHHDKCKAHNLCMSKDNESVAGFVRTTQSYC